MKRMKKMEKNIQEVWDWDQRGGPNPSQKVFVPFIFCLQTGMCVCMCVFCRQPTCGALAVCCSADSECVLPPCPTAWLQLQLPWGTAKWPASMTCQQDLKDGVKAPSDLSWARTTSDASDRCSCSQDGQRKWQGAPAPPHSLCSCYANHFPYYCFCGYPGTTDKKPCCWFDHGCLCSQVGLSPWHQQMLPF